MNENTVGNRAVKESVAGAEYGSIEREIHIEAAPDVVYEVISTPEHLRGWWPDEAELVPSAGGAGVFTFGDGSTSDLYVVPLTVIEADPPRRFSFRWTQRQYQGEAPAPEKSFLVVFDLVPAGAGTLLRMTESGFREQGWEAAVLEEYYRDHVIGWDYYLPRLVTYVAKLAPSQ